jgi:hypothetical protein
MVPSIGILDARACWYQVKSTVSNSVNVDSLPVFYFLHALPHFCICLRISFFLANIEFNVLAGNPSRFVISTHLSPWLVSTSCIIFKRSCKVLTLFFGGDILILNNANIDDSKQNVTW